MSGQLAREMHQHPSINIDPIYLYLLKSIFYLFKIHQFNALNFIYKQVGNPEESLITKFFLMISKRGKCVNASLQMSGNAPAKRCTNSQHYKGTHILFKKSL